MQQGEGVQVHADQQHLPTHPRVPLKGGARAAGPDGVLVAVQQLARGRPLGRDRVARVPAPLGAGQLAENLGHRAHRRRSGGRVEVRLFPRGEGREEQGACLTDGGAQGRDQLLDPGVWVHRLDGTVYEEGGAATEAQGLDLRFEIAHDPLISSCDQIFDQPEHLAPSTLYLRIRNTYQ